MVDENKINLVMGKDGKWSFPKGKIDKTKDRNGYECCRRKFLEESGLVGFTYVYNQNPIFEFDQEESTTYKFYFCKIIYKSPEYCNIKTNENIIESRWMNIDELMEIPDEKTKQIGISLLKTIDHLMFEKVDKFMVPWKEIKISKNISYWLRHNLNEFKSVTTDAFVDIDELLKKMNSDPRSEFVITEDDIDHINFHCFKQRTQIDGSKIRCVQGHSSGNINDDELLELITEPITNCYHATEIKLLNLIMKNGLNKMKRKHIHFATDENLLRKNRGILIEVKMKEAMDNGIKFYKAKNNVILSPDIIPPQYLIIHKI